MNRFKCPACGGNQYTSADTAKGCIFCGHQMLEKMDKLEPEKVQELAKEVGGWEKGGMANRRYANVREYVIV